MALEHFRKPEDKTYDEWDMFCLKPMKDRVVDILQKINPPLTMALYGQWGTGKTEMINAVISDLENMYSEETTQEKYLTLYFDAWEYRKEENIALAVLTKLFKKFSEDFSYQLKKKGKKVFESLLYVGSSVGTKVVTGGLSDISTVEKGLKLSEKKYKNYEKYVDEVEALKENYKNLIASILKSTNTEKIFIFVDNLDRCLPDVVVNLLENISIFLSYKDVKCVYTLAMDKEHVVKAINQMYPDFEGEKYLEKIIHFDLHMPILNTGIEAFADVYENIFGYRQVEVKLEPGEGIALPYDLSSYLEDHFLDFGSLIPPEKAKDVMIKTLRQIENIFDKEFLGNPRRMHKVIRQLFVLEENTKKTKHNFLMLIFLCSFKEFFPAVYFSLSPETDINTLIQLINQSITFNHEAFNKMQYNTAREAKDYLLSVKNSILSNAFIQNNLFRKFLSVFIEWKNDIVSKKSLNFKDELVKTKSMLDVFV